MTGSEVSALQRQPVHSRGSFSSLPSEKCNRIFSSPECTHVWTSYTSHHLRLQLGIALLRSTRSYLQFLTGNPCSYQCWWPTTPTGSVRWVLKPSIFILSLAFFFWLIFVFIINTTMGICNIHDSIMKKEKQSLKAFPSSILINLTEEFSRPQEKWATHKIKRCCR